MKSSMLRLRNRTLNKFKTINVAKKAQSTKTLKTRVIKKITAAPRKTLRVVKQNKIARVETRSLANARAAASEKAAASLKLTAGTPAGLSNASSRASSGKSTPTKASYRRSVMGVKHFQALLKTVRANLRNRRRMPQVVY